MKDINNSNFSSFLTTTNNSSKEYAKFVQNLESKTNNNNSASLLSGSGEVNKLFVPQLNRFDRKNGGGYSNDVSSPRDDGDKSQT